MALKRFNRVLELHPDFGEGDALLERAFCRRSLRDDPAAADDLLRFLRDYGKRGLRNELALLELLSVSLDEFLRALDLPPVPVDADFEPQDSHDGLWLLSRISLRLICFASVESGRTLRLG
jgi:hypothetical protein